MPGELLSSPLIEIAQALRDKRVTAQELVEAAIGRHERFGERLNAYSLWSPEQARVVAKAADAAFAAGVAVGPLQGLPVSIKDLLAASGCPCQSRDNQWPGDIAAWREAGGSHISVVTDARITDGSVLEAERSQCLSRGRIFEHGAKALHRRAVEYLATGGRAALQGCGRSLARPLSALFGFSRYSLRVDPVFRSRHLDRHIRKENVHRRVVGLALMIQ